MALRMRREAEVGCGGAPRRASPFAPSLSFCPLHLSLSSPHLRAAGSGLQTKCSPRVGVSHAVEGRREGGRKKKRRQERARNCAVCFSPFSGAKDAGARAGCGRAAGAKGPCVEWGGAAYGGREFFLCWRLALGGGGKTTEVHWQQCGGMREESHSLGQFHVRVWTTITMRLPTRALFLALLFGACTCITEVRV